jgi:hypothetical protein
LAPNGWEKRRFVELKELLCTPALLVVALNPGFNPIWITAFRALKFGPSMFRNWVNAPALWLNQTILLEFAPSRFVGGAF